MSTTKTTEPAVEMLPLVLPLEAEPARRVTLDANEIRLVLHALTGLRIRNIQAHLAGDLAEWELIGRDAAISRVARKLGAK